MTPLQARVLWAVAAVVVAVAAATITIVLTDDDGDAPTAGTTSTATTGPDGSGTTTPPPSSGCTVEPPPAAPGTVELRVFFTCGDGFVTDPLVPVVRRVPDTPGVLRATLQAMVEGPTDEEAAAGLARTLPAEAAGAEVGVTLEGGVARVSIGFTLGSVNGFSTSNGSGLFADGLHANAFQFGTVDAVVVVGQCPGEVTCSDGPDGPETPPMERAAWEASRVACPAPLPRGSLCPPG